MLRAGYLVATAIVSTTVCSLTACPLPLCPLSPVSCDGLVLVTVTVMATVTSMKCHPIPTATYHAYRPTDQWYSWRPQVARALHLFLSLQGKAGEVTLRL